jgi:hypothetical protein
MLTDRNLNVCNYTHLFLLIRHLLEEIPFLGFENKLKYFIKCLSRKCLENFCHNILTICFLKINDMKTDLALLINK